MTFLLVNDDGITSTRLEFAKQVLQKYGKVITVAPENQQSGTSVSISIKAIEFREIDELTYAICGTPADCVSFAIYGLNIKPDIVISGINKGFNVGVDTMYSGTVGAALQANYHGFKAIAFSGDYKGDRNVFDYFEETFKFILNNKLLSKEYILNVNFPKESFIENHEITLTKLHYVRMKLKGEIKQGTYSVFTHAREILPQEIPKDSDVYALKNGKTSISKIYLLDNRVI